MYHQQIDADKGVAACSNTSRRPSNPGMLQQQLRRRASSRIEPPMQSEEPICGDDQGPFSDTFRARQDDPSLYDVDSFHQSSRYFLDNQDGTDMFDTIPLTPAMYVSDAGDSGLFPLAGAAPPTSVGSLATQGYLDVPETQWRPENSRKDSDVSVYSASSVGSPGAVVSSLGASSERSEPKLGVLEKFTQKWPHPLPLKASGNVRTTGGADLVDAELRKSVDAVLLESGVGGGFGMLGLEWFSKWTSFKWCLLFSVLSVLVYGVAGVVCAVATWSRIWQDADVMYVADTDILILIAFASSILVIAALTGLAGTLLSSRPILAIYALLLWPSLISMTAIGYTAYKRATFALDHKLDMSWSQYYTPLGRLLIQNTLKCCGWSSPGHEGTPSRSCYPRTPLPGCKGPLTRFEQENLQLVWSTVFSLILMHLVNIVVVMLCANHVTKTFGSGITPKRYRLTANDVKEDAGRVLQVMKRAGGLDVRAVGGIGRPSIVRMPTSRAFREDKEERAGLLEGYFDEVRGDPRCRVRNRQLG